MVDSLNFLSVNIRGLNNHVKRKRVLSQILKSHSDVVFLQETHVKNPKRHPLPHKKFPTFFSSASSSRSRGVSILIAKHVPFLVKDVLQDPQGRYIMVKGQIEKMVVTLVSLYAPNTNQIGFLEPVFDQMSSFREGSLVVGGDFNQVMDPRCDKSHHPNHSRKPSFSLVALGFLTWHHASD